jgi:mannitol/fructose-specific phosphotransferase system IIA component (Ntr-type)
MQRQQDAYPRKIDRGAHPDLYDAYLNTVVDLLMVLIDESKDQNMADVLLEIADSFDKSEVITPLTAELTQVDNLALCLFYF